MQEVPSMYSAVLMLALTTGSDTVDFGRRCNSCNGCYSSCGAVICGGGCHSSCHSSCHGGGGWFRRGHGCHGCHGCTTTCGTVVVSCNGCSGCHSSCSGWFGGRRHHRGHGCHGCSGYVCSGCEGGIIVAPTTGPGKTPP